MTAIIDTNFLFALSDKDDQNYHRVLSVMQRTTESLLLPSVALPEICYLLASRLGHQVMHKVLASVMNSEITIEQLKEADLVRAYEILESYADSQLDFVDAAIVAIAERRNITRILTLDRRDFSIIRPKHCSYFELLP